MFRKLTETVYASPQIALAQVAEAASQGFALVINNRPDDEEPGQIPGSEIAAAALAAGLGYVAIPVTHAGFSDSQVTAMTAALAGAGVGKVVAYCRSGTRSTLLWSLAEASRGVSPDALQKSAVAAGYDLSPVRALLDMLAARQA